VSPVLFLLTVIFLVLFFNSFGEFRAPQRQGPEPKSANSPHIRSYRLNCVYQIYSGSQNVTVLGNKVIADVVRKDKLVPNMMASLREGKTGQRPRENT
jgi:hypothetical protein